MIPAIKYEDINECPYNGEKNPNCDTCTILCARGETILKYRREHNE